MDEIKTFALGERVTLMSPKGMVSYDGRKNRFYFGQPGFWKSSAIIISFVRYVQEKGCWSVNIELTNKKGYGGCYGLRISNILECEFQEWDEIKKGDHYEIF